MSATSDFYLARAAESADAARKADLVVRFRSSGSPMLINCGLRLSVKHSALVLKTSIASKYP